MSTVKMGKGTFKIKILIKIFKNETAITVRNVSCYTAYDITQVILSVHKMINKKAMDAWLDR